MTRWLLSGHNPQESFGISYPITVDYSVQFAAREQVEGMLRALAGSTGEMDLSRP